MSILFGRENERNERGEFTQLALALQSIAGNGCDCSNDESFTCLACLSELALGEMVSKLEKTEEENRKIILRLERANEDISQLIEQSKLAMHSF